MEIGMKLNSSNIFRHQQKENAFKTRTHVQYIIILDQLCVAQDDGNNAVK